jgi:hypothetical protein
MLEAMLCIIISSLPVESLLPDDEREVLLELLDRLAAQAFYSTASLSFLRTTVGRACERPVWKTQKKKERKEGKGFWVKRKSLSMGSKT